MTADPKPKRKYKHKTERQKLDADCLELWSLCVRTRDKTCRNCNSDYLLQAHHIVQRTYKLSRYNTKNGLCLCKGCHFPEKFDFEGFRNMVIDIIGAAEYEAMQDIYRVKYKWSMDELKTIKEELKAELRRLEGE